MAFLKLALTSNPKTRHCTFLSNVNKVQEHHLETSSREKNIFYSYQYDLCGYVEALYFTVKTVLEFLIILPNRGSVISEKLTQLANVNSHWPGSQSMYATYLNLNFSNFLKIKKN